VVRLYDHEVQGGTAVKPLVGIANHGPSDATVLVPQNSQMTIDDLRLTIEEETPNRQSSIQNRKSIKGAALSNGINPRYGEHDPYAMAWANIDEAFRNAVAVGADPDQISILDNFCWGNPNLPDRLGSLVRCAQGCYDAAIAYQTPFVSGKDSLNNEYTGADGEKHAIPGTLLISALGIVPDVNKTVSMDLKSDGNLLFVIGNTRHELVGSHYGIVNGQLSMANSQPPQPIKNPLERYRALYQAIQADLVESCHDCAEGGLTVALAEMCLAGGLGAMVQTTAVSIDGALTDTDILFSESQGRLVVEVKPENALAFRQQLQNVPHAQIGIVSGDKLVISGRTASTLVSLSMKELNEAWRGHLGKEEFTIDDLRLTKSNKSNRQSPIVNRQSPKVLILHANGTNRDHDAALACELAGGTPEIVHINQLLSGEKRFSDYNMLVIPGGFSYGDDLGAGVLWGMDLRERFEGRLQQFVENGRPVLGICNGFQVLVKSGLLQIGDSNQASSISQRPITLTYNESEQFECRWVYLEPNPNSASLFTQGLSEPIYCPVAHGEGRFSVKDESIAKMLVEDNLIPLQYTNTPIHQINSQQSTINNVDSRPLRVQQLTVGYPANPNGSVLDIAALSNPAGNVMGLMPHPENHIFPWQHPRTHRGEAGMDGLRLFANGIKHA
jgi:phosphoribosylformylglycinamidine (FGAM) synthase-like amidotransferase family enzyme